MPPRTYPDASKLKASIQDLLHRRYGETGEDILKLGLPDDSVIEKRLLELIEFYKTPWPNANNESPQWNVWYVLAPSGYAKDCLLYTSPSPRDRTRSRMPSSA